MNNFFYFLPGTILFVFALRRQLIVLKEAKRHDPLLDSKIMFPAFNICYMLTVPCIFFHWIILGAVLYSICGVIVFYTYYKKMRIKAIYKSLYHGLLPFWVYEKERHYACSYLKHLQVNIKYAFRWLTFTEDESDVEFEKNTNK